jgi:hypothetical protein
MNPNRKRPEQGSLAYLVAAIASAILISIAVGLQFAQWGDPTAHWFWCTVLTVC